jgi:hypothetical protein
MGGNNVAELTEEQIRASLLTKATQGALIANWKKHPAFNLYLKALENVLADKKNSWLTGTEEEAKAARQEAKGILKAIQILKMFENTGVVAKKALIEAGEETEA